MPTNPQQSQHESILLESLSPRVVGAIRGIAREEAVSVFEANANALNELEARVEELFAQHGATPQVRQTAAAVAAANAAQNDAAAGRASDDAVSGHIQRANDLAAATGAPAPVVNPPRRTQRPASSLEQRVSRLESRVDGLDTAVAHAVAIAIGGGGGSKGNAIRVFWGTLMGSGIIYLLIACSTSVKWHWFNQFAWPIGLAAVVSYLAYLLFSSREERMARTAYAEAHASIGRQRVNHDNGGLAADLMDGFFGAQGHAQANGGNGAHADAIANTGQGQAHAGASAGAH